MRARIEPNCSNGALVIAHSPPGERMSKCYHDNRALSSTALAKKQWGCNWWTKESSKPKNCCQQWGPCYSTQNFGQTKIVRSSFCESWARPYSKPAQTEYSILFIVKKLLSPQMPSTYSLPLYPDLSCFSEISLSPKETKDHSHQCSFPGELYWIQLPKVSSYLLLSGD